MIAFQTRVSWPVIDVGSFSRKYITKNIYFHICSRTNKTRIIMQSQNAAASNHRDESRLGVVGVPSFVL